MPFQYYFFGTYPGYFLQVLPIALLVSGVYGFARYRGDSSAPLVKKLLSCVFVCYMTGLFCLVIGLDVIGNAWYRLLYRMEPGRTIHWFAGEIDLIPDFFHRINDEVIGNVLMFLPFGILYPLTRARPAWKNTVGVGLAVVLLIEVLQPVVGRTFDVNDIILNTVGIAISATVFAGICRLSGRKGGG